MSELERLDEALAGIGRPPGDIKTPTAILGTPEALGAVLNAARAYRNLLANGERVEWCEKHRSALHVPNPLTEKRCDVWVAARLDGWDTKEPCRIVSMLLVDPGKGA